FDPETYGNAGGLLGRLLALQAERYQPPSGESGQAPATQQVPDNGPSASAAPPPGNAYLPYDAARYEGQGGLLGRLLALQRPQSGYRPTAGAASSPPAPSAPTQAQDEADQAQQAREAAAERLARGVRKLTRVDAAAPVPIGAAPIPSASSAPTQAQ